MLYNMTRTSQHARPALFRRKVTDELKKWKERYAPGYAALIEGARRVGKSTVAEEFAKNNYRSYIKIDFANVTKELAAVFDDIANLNIFFLRLQALTGIKLHERDSVIIFDEIQMRPPVRQAIKYLVADGRYDYIETGSLISIRKNVKNIVIPSEEHRIQMFPMDFEEFLWATGSDTYNAMRELFRFNVPAGNEVNRKLMRDFRIFMAVGGMPQAVEAYANGRNFEQIDLIKRRIINLYMEDFKKIDPSGYTGKMYQSIPAQLAAKKKKFLISTATGKRKIQRDLERLSELLDSRTVIPCYNTTNPDPAVPQTRDVETYKLYLSDTGLFTTMLFMNDPVTGDNIYSRLLSDKLPANLGYLYENAVAQMIASTGRELYYHTWEKKNSTHYYEIDFLLQNGTKIIPLEVKSSASTRHISMDEFCKKYSKHIVRPLLISQKDTGHDGQLELKPVYMLHFILEELDRTKKN